MDATMSSKNQITVPKAVREHLHAKPGTKFKFFILANGEVVIAPKLPVTALKGIVPKLEKPLTIEEMNAAIAEGATRRYDRFIEDSRSK
jgi:antitoxin PrlF